MGFRSKRRQAARRLRFENLEGRWLLTSLTETNEIAFANDSTGIEVASEQTQVASASADLRMTAEVQRSLRLTSSSDAEGESSDTPVLVQPLAGAIVDGPTVTLEFEPLPGYTGNYLVRLHDAHWDGRQATGFRHDSSLHYLSISTKSTRITLPVEAGEDYSWWVHKPGFAAAGGKFSVAATPIVPEDNTPPEPPPPAPEPTPDPAPAPAPAPVSNVPTLVSPQQGDVVDGTTVTLEFEPIPGYTGNYLVRLNDAHWNGRQATGFQHDSKLHYLSISTKSTRFTLPVEAGEEYSWWVHKPGGVAAGARFSVAATPTVPEDNTPPEPPPAPEPTPTPAPVSNVPTLVSPQQGDVIEGTTVTLEFEPLPGYTGNYLVRLHDAHWNGRQATGFQHDSKSHYLSISTKSTRITLPVEAGEDYSWWVHKPGFAAAGARFSVAAATTVPEDNTPPPVSDIPTLVSPQQGDVIEGPTVTLEFEPLPGYTGNYLVRLNDAHWDGRQATGFQHDSKLHYLSISTKSTRITLPVEAGEEYSWWVHKPGLQAARATFTTSAMELADPELIDGRYRCTDLEQYDGTTIDVSPILQHCVDSVPLGATLELPVGQYYLSHQVVVNRRIVLTSVGKSIDDPAVIPGNGDAAHLIAHPDLDVPFGLLYLGDIEAMHHIIVDGNKENRLGTPAHQRIVDTHVTRYGFNALVECDDATLVGNVFQNALAGSGLGVKGSRRDLVIRDNKFLDNGFHTRWLLWADGLTVHDVSNSQIVGNEFRDNTDIDLIFGGAQNSIIQDNTIVHTSDLTGGAFAGLMIHKWANSSGDYSGTDISGNIVDGGPNRDIGSGIYVASEGWYSETPFGRTTNNPVRATIHNNVSRNVKNGMYLAARGFSIYENQYENAHGITFAGSRGAMRSNTPIVVSQTTSDIDYHNENVDAATRQLFESQTWIGSIPNWPF